MIRRIVPFATVVAACAVLAAAEAPSAALTIEDLETARDALAAAADALDEDALTDVAGRLEDVPSSDALAWLARYYEGLAWYRVGEQRLDEGDKRRARKAFERSASSLQNATSLNPDASDAWALLGATYGAQIRLTPWKRLFWAPKADRALRRAMELSPENPRAWLLRATRSWFAAGGDPDELGTALEDLDRAIALFPLERQPTLPAPRWGEAEAWALVAAIRMDLGQLDEARAALDQAGFANPESGRITNHLQARLAGLVESSARP